MYLYKRGNVYWVEYMVNGKRYQQSCKTSRRDVAATFLNSIKVAAKMPTFDAAVEVLRRIYDKPAPGVVKLAAIWDTYLQVARSVGRDKCSADTMRKREGTIKNLVAWLKKHRPLVATAEAVTQPVAAAYAAALAADVRYLFKAKRSKAVRGTFRELLAEPGAWRNSSEGWQCAERDVRLDSWNLSQAPRPALVPGAHYSNLARVNVGLLK